MRAQIVVLHRLPRHMGPKIMKIRQNAQNPPVSPAGFAEQNKKEEDVNRRAVLLEDRHPLQQRGNTAAAATAPIVFEAQTYVRALLMVWILSSFGPVVKLGGVLL